MQPQCSIIIPTFNHLEDCLKPCIQSVIQYTDLTKNEIVVVCNGCTDGTEEWVKSLNQPNIQIVSFPEPLGYTKATNQGILRSSGSYIVLLNNDCQILAHNQNGWLDWLMGPFLSVANMGVTGPQKLWCPHSKHWFIIFFCAMIKRTVIEKLGLLDESFNPGGGEDTEYSIRAKANGYEITMISPDSEVWSYGTPFPIYHQAEATVNGLSDWDAIFNRNSATLAERYKEKSKYSIIVLAPADSAKLKRCVHSVWKNTDYHRAEVLIVCYENEESFEYARGVHINGPYKIIQRPSRIDRNVAVMDAVKAAEGEFVVILDGDAHLLQHDRDGWLEELAKPFMQRDVAITSHEVNGQWASPYLIMTRLSLVRGFSNLIDFIQDRHATHRTVRVGEKSLGVKSRFEQFPITYEP